MKIKLFSAVLGIALSATVINASAQKAYTEGTVTLNTTMRGQPVVAKQYFTKDSVANVVTMGPATIRFLADANLKSFAVLIDVPVASIKKAGIATPDEVDQAISASPTFTFAPTTETKQISGFNCKKVVATDAKTKKAYDIWVTNDITVSSTAVPRYYLAAGGFPVQYTAFQQGQAADVTVTSVTDEKAPKGTFTIGPDFDKVTMEDLRQMGGGH